MANWNLEKQNQLHALQEDQRIFYSSILPEMVKTFQSILGSAVDIQMVADMILNATEIRAMLKDWDRSNTK